MRGFIRRRSDKVRRMPRRLLGWRHPGDRRWACRYLRHIGCPEMHHGERRVATSGALGLWERVLVGREIGSWKRNTSKISHAAGGS